MPLGASSPSLQSLQVLLVEDSPDDAELIARALQREGFSLAMQRVETADALREALVATPFDIILTDCRLPGFSGLQALILVRQLELDVPLIVVSGSVGEETAADLMRAGARDYVSKDRLGRLGPAVRREVAEAHTRADRLAADERLRELQGRFQAILDHSPAMIYLKDLDGRYVLANRLFEQRFGRDGQSVIGRRADEILDHAAATTSINHDAAVLSRGEPVACENEVQDADGRRVYFSQKFLLRTADGAPCGLGAIALDITERRQIQQQLLQAQKMEAFGQLAGGVAHDFNNILAVLLMHFALMPMQAELPAPTRATLKQLEQVVNRAVGLVRQLLIFSRRHEVLMETLDLSRTVDGVCKMLRRILGEHIAFEFDAGRQPMPIRADAGMIEQVVMNLCVNARDAMPQGGTLHVSVTSVFRGRDAAAPAQAHAVLTVRDTGHGMDEATKRRIFEPFFTTKPVGYGTGLGLATVDGIVKQHGGWVEVDSVVGQGTTFRVYLPMAHGTAVEILTPTAELPHGSGRILLVEDESAVRYVAASGLRLAGYEVVEAADAPEAEHAWTSRGPFQLLLTDMVMPGGVTGLELAQRLRARDPSLAVILMSGYYGHAVDPELPPNASRIAKPFSLAVLLELVRSKLTAPSRPPGSL